MANGKTYEVHDEAHHLRATENDRNYKLKIFYLLFFWPHMACGILVPRPGIKSGPSAVKAPSPDHWTIKEFPVIPSCWSISYAGEDDPKGGIVKATEQEARDFPGGPVVKNLPCNVGDAGSVSSWGSKIPQALEQQGPCATTREFVHPGERFRVLQQRLGATKYINELIKQTNKQEAIGLR